MVHLLWYYKWILLCKLYMPCLLSQCKPWMHVFQLDMCYMLSTRQHLLWYYRWSLPHKQCTLCWRGLYMSQSA